MQQDDPTPTDKRRTSTSRRRTCGGCGAWVGCPADGAPTVRPVTSKASSGVRHRHRPAVSLSTREMPGTTYRTARLWFSAFRTTTRALLAHMVVTSAERTHAGGIRVSSVAWRSVLPYGQHHTRAIPVRGEKTGGKGGLMSTPEDSTCDDTRALQALLLPLQHRTLRHRACRR